MLFRSKEERSRFRFDSQEGKECRARELDMLGQKHDMGDSCEDSSKEEEKGILVQSCDDGEPRAMKKDTDSDSDQDSEHVGNRRRGRMKLGPRASSSLYCQAATGRKSLWERTTALHIRVQGRHSDNRNRRRPDSGRQRRQHTFTGRRLARAQDGERPEAVPSERFPAYMPPRTQVFGYDDRALRFATIRFGHWESGVSLAIVWSVRGGAEYD